MVEFLWIQSNVDERTSSFLDDTLRADVFYQISFQKV